MVRPISAQSRNELRMSEQAERFLQSAKTPIEKVRFSCLRRGAVGIMQFAKIFRRFDNDHSGTFNLEEFAQGINESGVSLTQQEIEQLFQEFDIDGSGSVDYNEFLRAIRPPLNEHRRGLIFRAFDKLDHTQDGQITIDDLKNVFNVHSHPDYLNGDQSEDKLLQDFLRKFEENGIIDGIVTRDEFVDYYAGVSASIDDDMYFDLMMRQAWRL